MPKEKTVKALGLERLTQHLGCVLRNNLNGTFYAGALRSFKNGVITLIRGRILKTGVNGYPDSSGWRSIIVTPAMVGRKIAVFVALEWKRSEGGRLSPEQEKWLQRIIEDGGLAGAPRNVEEAEAIVTAYDRE